jgi:alanine transaminase
MDCMVNPPAPTDPSHATYIAERTAILESLKRRAAKLTDELNRLPGMQCLPAEGTLRERER